MVSGPLFPYPEDYTFQAALVGMMGQSPQHSPRATQSPLAFTPQIPVIPLQKPYEMLITNHPWMQVSSGHEDMCNLQDPVPEDFESISDFGSLHSTSEPSKYECVRVYKKTREKQS
ncbi:hypothetical protein AAG906_012122 [Vitis piasezkii]